MRRTLKSIFRISSRKKDAGTRSPAKERQNQHTARPAPSAPSAPSAPCVEREASQPDGTHRQSQKESLQPRQSASIAANDIDSSVSKDVDDSIAESYRAYMPAVSPGPLHYDAKYMSLGGDSRLTAGEGQRDHNEDVANRNIETYGVECPKTPTKGQEGIQELGDRVAQFVARANGKVRNYRVHTAFNIVLGSVDDTSITSIGSPTSLHSRISKNSGKYSLGTGIATEGSLVDGIMPHVKSPSVQPYNRRDWPVRKPREKIRESQQIQASTRDTEEDDRKARQRQYPVQNHTGSGLSKESQPDHHGRRMSLKHALVDGEQGHNEYRGVDLDGVVDLRDTEDTDGTIQWAPAVTHEVVKPHEHEIIEECVYREIHNHDVYHRTLPVYETEILPARHFMHDSNGGLKEISEDKIPGWTGQNQKWYIGEKTTPDTEKLPFLPRQTEPRILADRTYMTPEGFPRRETTILHPPELDDLSDYTGIVMPIEFVHHDSKNASLEEPERKNGARDNYPVLGSFSFESLKGPHPSILNGVGSS
ncbi:hypothetical protein P280DRAFT_87557 [Massarina eburnea CBS 473.64]|uniref:Uncharacterized protein n=1 Tax=Massarina eburnea CBS 473.64 TaxID=1395130 RepID=A0A6A6RRL3_9PLEO|nr:hypothetical protein P280DRAFT_87557 [Massarina eburnea CBS 473.64]